MHLLINGGLPILTTSSHVHTARAPFPGAHVHESCQKNNGRNGGRHVALRTEASGGRFTARLHRWADIERTEGASTHRRDKSISPITDYCK